MILICLTRKLWQQVWQKTSSVFVGYHLLILKGKTCMCVNENICKAEVFKLFLYYLIALSSKFMNVDFQTDDQLILWSDFLTFRNAQNDNFGIFMFHFWSNVSRRHFEVYKLTFITFDTKWLKSRFIDMWISHETVFSKDCWDLWFSKTFKLLE